MADHEAAIKDRLLEHSGTAALVGTRVHRSRLPQERASGGYMPAVVIQQIPGGQPPYSFGGSVGKVLLTVQVDVYDTDASGCQTLYEQVRDALENYQGTQGSVLVEVIGMSADAPSWEPSAKLWRAQPEFELWGSE